MEWYTGSIEQAVKEVRENTSYLCVFVRDDKPASDAMLEAINKVATSFSSYTSIQLTFGTATCQQFSVYYPVLVVPSLYIVDGSGVCLAVIADKDKISSILADVTKGTTPSVPSSTAAPPPASAPPSSDLSTTVTPESIAEKIVRAQALGGVSNGTSVESTASSSDTTITSDNTVTSDTAVTSDTTVTTDTNVTSDTNAPGDSATTADAGKQKMSLEEKQRRARELLEEKARKDALEARELEKQRERERRETGQAMLEQKKKREEEALRKHSEEIRRTKATQKAEMEAIRAQIARDKAERRGETYTGPSPAVTPPAATPAVKEGTVRVQIKFPATDTTLVKTFEEGAPLHQVAEYAKQELQKENFTLWNTFPRKQFKVGDLGLSLKDLGLRGSVSLLGMSGKGYTPPSSSSQVDQQRSASSASSSVHSIAEKPLAQTRIQFKRSDGSSLLHIFDKDTQLVDVIKHFESQCGDDLGKSVLWSLFPRYEISQDHVTRTLAELDMCPSAVIFVVAPSSGGNHRGQELASSSGIWEFLLTIIQLPLNILEYIRGILFPVPARRPVPPPLTPAADQQHPLQHDSREGSQLRKRTKLDGNIGRLNDGRRQSDEDEDNNTWNGNSTQLQ